MDQLWDLVESLRVLPHIAALTFASGVVSATRMAETLPPRLRATPHADRESGTSMPGSQPHLAVDTRRLE